MGLHDRDYGRHDTRTPWDRIEKPRSMTIMLIIINVALFLLNWLVGDKATAWMGAYGSTLLQPWMWWQWLTYGFAHDPNNINHILFNMIGLYFFGRIIEQRLGQNEFLKFYLIAIIFGGIVGSVGYLISGSPVPVIGASGGVVATVILFACYYPNSEILLMFVFPVKAWVLATFFVAADFAGAIGLVSLTGANTAFTVHLAGAGFSLAYFFGHWNLRWIDFDFFTDLPNRLQQRSRRMKLKIHDPDKKQRDEAEQADRILDKIHKQGESSLTKSERKILERYSRRKREQRDQV